MEKLKITNTCQFERLVHEMVKNPSFAKGFRRNTIPNNFNEHWESLATVLNSLGPPTRTGDGWRKIWRDLKFKVKKKMAAIKAECKTAKGKQVKLSPLEEAVANLLQFEKILNPEGTVQGVQHIEDSVDYCSLEQHDLESKAAVPSISSASAPLTESMSLISTSDENTCKRTELLQRHSIDQARILTEMSNSLGSIKHSLQSIQEIRAKRLKLEMERSKREKDMHLTDMNIKKTQLSIKKKELQLLNLN